MEVVTATPDHVDDDLAARSGRDNDNLLHDPPPVVHNHRRRIAMLVGGGGCAAVAIGGCILFFPQSSVNVPSKVEEVDEYGGGACFLAKAGLYGYAFSLACSFDNTVCDDRTTSAITSYYFARAAVPSSTLNSSSLPLLVHFSRSDPPPALLPCIAPTNNAAATSSWIRNPHALNRDAHVLYLRYAEDLQVDLHAFLASTLRAANISTKREVRSSSHLVQINHYITSPPFQVLTANFHYDPITTNRTYLNVAGVAFRASSPSTVLPTKALGQLLDAGVRVHVDDEDDPQDASNWTQSISW
ncbi:hypothetical protein B5M09_010540 [Aphanomyces astaci]|uniref:Uncharacterized protein n=1 Tax=Aphanomyces astaci TaxID=112090 RepID=A0A3R7ZH99_APHAT|nr:hypothetical protein B5M09_010540 [Aphanomyces astaci]